MNQLMNPELKNLFAETGNQHHSSDPVILAHFFMISASYHWLAIEFDEKTNSCLGYCYEVTTNGYDGVWCKFSLEELSKITHSDPEMPIPDIKLDSFFPNNRKFSEVCPKDFSTWQEYKNMQELENIEQAIPELEYER